MLVSFATYTPAAGRFAGKPVEYVSIKATADARDEVHRLATDADKERFPVEYAAFKPAPKQAAPAVIAPPAPELADVTPVDAKPFPFPFTEEAPVDAEAATVVTKAAAKAFAEGFKKKK